MNTIIQIKNSYVEFYLNENRLFVSIFAEGQEENVCIEREIKKDELINLIWNLQSYCDEIS